MASHGPALLPGRLVAGTVLLSLLPALAAEDAVAPTSPSASAPAVAPAATAGLDDASVVKQVSAIFGELRTLHISLGSTIEPATVATQLQELKSLVAQAAHPNGAAALQARLIEGQLLIAIGSSMEGESVLVGVFRQSDNLPLAASAAAMLAQQYQQQGRLDALKALLDQSTSRKLEQRLLDLLSQQIAAESLSPVGHAFDDFSLTDLDGHVHTLAEYAGKLLLINVWSMASAPSVRTLPSLVAAYGHYHALGLEVLGLSLDKDPALLRRFIGDHAMPWPEACDGKSWHGDFAQKYAITAIPEIYVIGRTGLLLAKHLTAPQLDEVIARALGVPRAAP